MHCNLTDPSFKKLIRVIELADRVRDYCNAGRVIVDNMKEMANELNQELKVRQEEKRKEAICKANMDHETKFLNSGKY